MLVLRFERLFAGKSAQTLRAQSVCRRLPVQEEQRKNAGTEPCCAGGGQKARRWTQKEACEKRRANV